MKLLLLAPAVDTNARLGFDRSGTFGIGACLGLCLLLFVVPRTRFLGAVLLTGYLGGAVAAHVRAGSSLFETVFPVFTGVLVWGALFWLSAEGACAAVVPRDALIQVENWLRESKAQ